MRPTDQASSHPTGVDLELLRKIGARLCEVPEGFLASQHRSPHSHLKQIRHKLGHMRSGCAQRSCSMSVSHCVPGFKLHNGLKRQLKKKQEDFRSMRVLEV